MALLATQRINGAVTPSYAAANAGGDTVQAEEGLFLHFKNTGGAPITVTVVQATPCNMGGATPTHDLAVAVPATTGDRMLGPITPARFAGSGGLASITYSATPTGVTVAALKH